MAEGSNDAVRYGEETITRGAGGDNASVDAFFDACVQLRFWDREAPSATV